MEAKKVHSQKSHSSSRMQTCKSSSSNSSTTAHKPAKSKSTSALPKNQSRSKKDNYRMVSKSSLLQDFKSSAANGLANVKQRFNSFSTLLKHSKKSKANLENYAPINEQPTPVKLYSPFTFESPACSKVTPEERLRIRQQLFASPTNRIGQDVANLETGIEELNFLAQRVETNYQLKQQLFHPTNPFAASVSRGYSSSSSGSTSATSVRLMFNDENSLI
ncbi:hypothetical protein TYRP_006644 [Tyrophagus putrescentiae]|nr:hypothetical protein TYRP_006644 [Tyrophagus putrescentiae]